MDGEKIRFYLDENMPIEIAAQLKNRGIDVVTVRDLGLLGDDDRNHLRRATELGCVLCTQDSDFIQLASAGVEHGGIVFGQQATHQIGTWVNYLDLMYSAYTPDDMENKVEYL